MQFLRKLEPIGITLFLAIAFGFGVRLFSENTNMFPHLGGGFIAQALAATNQNPITGDGFKTTLVPGQSDIDVVYLKRFLQNTYGANVLPAGIYFDEKTSALLMKYQRDNTLAETGSFDEVTRVAVNDSIFASRCPKGSDVVDRSLTPLSQDASSVLPQKYVPNNLLALPTAYAKYSPFCLTKDTRVAAMQLIDDAKKEGVYIKVTSAFRSFAVQEYLHHVHFDVLKLVRNTVAKAGHSEHQLGTAVDFSGFSISYAGASSAFLNSPEYAWIKEHAGEYGFVQSYPRDKEKITGYAAEPWHFRYVGTAIAHDVAEQKITLYEYLVKLQNGEVSAEN